jgi:hypothetical protein
MKSNEEMIDLITIPAASTSRLRMGFTTMKFSSRE